jgi:hypothetical protein
VPLAPGCQSGKRGTAGGRRATLSIAAGAPFNGVPDSVRNFTVDTVIPTASIIDVTPDPRASAVASISAVFSEPAYGLDHMDLTLARNGSNVALTTAP